MGEQGAGSGRELERYDFIDLLKGIGIFLVVWGHTMEPRSVYIYSFHMPLFFFVSGYLHRDKPAREYFPNRIKRLYLPYLIFCALSWLFYLVVMMLRGRWDAVPAQLSKAVSILNGNANNGGNDTIWFLTCLLITGSLFWIVQRLRKGVLIWPAVAVSSVLGYMLGFHNVALPFKTDVALTGLVFYHLGHVAGRGNLIGYTERFGKRWFWAVVAAAEMVHIWAAYYNVKFSGIAKVAMTSNNLGNYFLFYASALAGIAVMMALGARIGKIVPLNRLGIDSLLILALHKPILYLIRLATTGLVDHRAWYYGLPASLATIALIWPLLGFIRRKLPWVFGIWPASSKNVAK